MAKLLLEKGAHVKPGRWMVLLNAGRSGHFGEVQLSLDAGADVNAKTSEVETALRTARANHHKEVEKLHTAHGAEE